MTRVFIWKNNCPQEWEEISFTAFRKARSSGAFSGRFFIETTRMIYDDSDRLIIECSQEQFEKYRHEERHSRYLQEHEGRYLTIPMSDLKDRDQSDEGYEDTDIFVNEEPGTEDMALHNLHQRYIARQIAALNRPLYFCCERSLRCLALYQAVIHQLVSGHGMMKRSALL